MAIMKFAPEALKNLFLKPVTTSYPAKPAEYPERSRGHIDIVIDECISCGMCVRVCPSSALSVDREKGTWTINRYDCIVCGFCAEKCPKKCLSVNPGYQTPGGEKMEAVYTKSPEVLAAEAAKRKEAAEKAAAVAKAKAEAAAKAKAEAEAQAAGATPVAEAAKTE